ncbi:retron St85 family effector protein [Endozoicomonas arenosclerae]|uniref:retron St85 family effector protein n=1 Tax=Endozoicomonas arenosclerae TaxID=1633495 RepID=UPI000A4D7C8E|nr:retron St85 family effector protein [Endozoicomonas arenosclerae]
MLKEIRSKRLLRSRLMALKKAIDNSHVYLKNDLKFVFLCGANKDIDTISERRKALIEFSKKNLPHTEFFLAEKMFSTLKKEGHKGNVLDVEHLISDFSDFIVIILESASSFAELGAFSHNTLRNKLVIINDSQFEKEESFINLGPIKAVEEAVGKDRIIHYKMNSDGVYNRDAIGNIYPHIYKLFKDPSKIKSKVIDLDSCNPSNNVSKKAAMFAHDLIYLSGPILHKELIELLKLIFGNNNYNDVAHILGILTSFDSIERNSRGLYRSRKDETYFDYRFDTGKIISTFRNYTLKSYPERIYEY